MIQNIQGDNMTIVLTGDKKVVSLLPSEDAKLVLLALFSEDGDLPEMSPLANMAYTSIYKSGMASNTMSAISKSGAVNNSNRNTLKQTKTVTKHIAQGDQVSLIDTSPTLISGLTDIHANRENGVGSHERRFDEFWAAYPRKVGKEAARKAWRRIKPTADHLAKVLLAIENAKKSCQWHKDNGQYIPNPATWLNQGRWDDEVQPYSTGQQNKKYLNMKNFKQREYNADFYELLITNDFGLD
jgi:hypothetical protein